MTIRVSVKEPKIQRAMQLLGDEKKVRRAAARAINRSLNAGKTAAIRAVPKEYAVKQKQVRQRITTSRAKENNLQAGVTWRGQSLNIADFRVRPGRPQPARRPILRAQVSRRNGFDPYQGAFLISTTRGMKAYRRTRDARADGTRYPITGVWGPSIPQLVGAKSVREAVEERAREQLDKRLDHEIDRLLGGGS